MAVAVLIAKIDRAASADGDAGVICGLYAVRDGTNAPGQAVILRHDDCLLTPAAFVRQINCAISRNHRVPVQATALRGVDRDAGTERQAAIVASSAEGGDLSLRAVINCIWINW